MSNHTKYLGGEVFQLPLHMENNFYPDFSIIPENVKANCDSGQFIAIQKAGIWTLQHIEITKENCKKYSRRHDMLVDMLRQIGFQASKPKGTFCCYVPIPKGTKSGIRFKNAEEASEYLIQHALVSTVPWDDAGAFLRFSVTYEAKDEEEEKRIMSELKDRLSRLELVF
ncbi:MAG: aminotransferase class I/II-fold pyridoxal phosphate-dependent enzyme [Bacillota bacterium]